METTEQEKHVPNPTGKGGFGDNPQNRNPGGWAKEKSIPYQYHRFLAMPIEEFESFKPITVVELLAYNRIQEARRSLNDIKEITDRTEGKAKQELTMNIEQTKKDINLLFPPLDEEGSQS
jgi:hypothetical protein